MPAALCNCIVSAPMPGDPIETTCPAPMWHLPAPEKTGREIPRPVCWQHPGLLVQIVRLEEEKLAQFEQQHDDYNAIMLKSLADRLAEALAEHTHRRVRRTLWAYDPHESLANEALIAEDYRGIRPAPGYPACPDHSEKEKIFELLDAEHNSQMELTSGYAMLPAASVSGYYFAHPQSSYFVLGNILEDQLLDYAKRKNISPEQARRLLAANIVL